MNNTNCNLSGGAGFCLWGDGRTQKQIGAIQLHTRRDAAVKPVLNSLNATSRLVVTKQFGKLCRPTKTSDQFGISHAPD